MIKSPPNKLEECFKAIVKLSAAVSKFIIHFFINMLDVLYIPNSKIQFLPFFESVIAAWPISKLLVVQVVFSSNVQYPVAKELSFMAANNTSSGIIYIKFNLLFYNFNLI